VLRDTTDTLLPVALEKERRVCFIIKEIFFLVLCERDLTQTLEMVRETKSGTNTRFL
jgi:hypothetical protein